MLPAPVRSKDDGGKRRRKCRRRHGRPADRGRRDQRRGHRTRCGGPRPVGAAGRAGRSGKPHLVRLHEADPWRPALSRIWRVPLGARGADRAGAAARHGAPHHLATRIRPAANAVAASGLDGSPRPLPLRSSRRAREAARHPHRAARTLAAWRRARDAFGQGVRLFRLLGGRQPSGRAERHGCCCPRRPDRNAHADGVRPSHGQRLDRYHCRCTRRARGTRPRPRQRSRPLGCGRARPRTRRAHRPRRPAGQGQPHHRAAAVPRRSRVHAAEPGPPDRVRYSVRAGLHARRHDRRGVERGPRQGIDQR